MIRETLDSLIKDSMLAKNTVRTNVLRAIKTKFVELQTAKNPKPLDEQAVIRKMIADRELAAGIYANAGRQDLVDTEELEIKYLQEFKEAEVSIGDTHNAVRAAFDNGAKNIGEVMKYVKSVLPTANMQIAAAAAKTILESK
jgi:uncharacterized protein YqeY